MENKIKQILANVDDTSTIKAIDRVTGGEINQAFYVATNKRAYFIKTNQQVPKNFFQFEALGLTSIAKTATIKVPEVYYYNEPDANQEAVLVLEWVKGEQNPTTAKLLGEQVATLHQQTKFQYGLGHDGFLGTLNQPNRWTDSWVNYFQNQRLSVQLNYGINQNVISGKRRDRLEKLIERLDNYLPEKPAASLLHGDLWGGNWLAGPNGQPYLIDPAILYGDRAFELAYTELFGGFPTAFYQAYQFTWSLDDHYSTVKPIYQLFFLLVHLNIFGERYGARVDDILSNYH